MYTSESTKPSGTVAAMKFGSTMAPSNFFYFDDLPNRRLRLDVMTNAQAAEADQVFARAERDKIDNQ